MRKWTVLFLALSIFIRAETNYPLLSIDTFLSFADHLVDDSAPWLDPSKVKTGDIIYAATPCLQLFFRKYLPNISTKFILVTSNSCGTIDEKYLPLLEDPRLIAWFGVNITLIHPKMHLIPLGIPGSRFPNHPEIIEIVKILKPIQQELCLDRFFKEKPIHTYLNIRPVTHSSRNAIRDYFASQPYCEMGSIKPFAQYIEDVKNARFVISPRGGKIDCYRTWETLYAGSIPVVESWGIDSIYEDLPVIIVDDLTTVTQELLDTAFEQMKHKTFNLEKLHADYWFNQLRQAQAACF